LRGKKPLLERGREKAQSYDFQKGNSLATKRGGLRRTGGGETVFRGKTEADVDQGLEQHLEAEKPR